MAEQFDVFVVDRCDAGFERADQANRIVASADAGLEHRKIASALLKVQAGQREQRFEGAELLPRRFEISAMARSIRCSARGKCFIADLGAVDLNPFVEAHTDAVR